MLTLDANIWVAAFDSHDRFHEPSVAFLRHVTVGRVRLHGPAFLLLEAACAIARRTGDAGVGLTCAERLQRNPLLTLHPLDRRLLTHARTLGLEKLLRGADALYAPDLTPEPTVSQSGEAPARCRRSVRGHGRPCWLAPCVLG